MSCCIKGNRQLQVPKSKVVMSIFNKVSDCDQDIPSARELRYKGWDYGPELGAPLAKVASSRACVGHAGRFLWVK